MHLNSTRKNKDNLLSAEYSICGSVLPVVSSVTDLCVSYDIRFSFRPRIINVLHKASLRAKLILKCFVTCDPSVLCKAFSVSVRPIMEFSSVIWNPHFKMDINMIEKVQRRFTKLTYPVRLSRLWLQH